jgi:hypothetical protein
MAKLTSQLISTCLISNTSTQRLRLVRDRLRSPQAAFLHDARLDQRLHLRAFAFRTQTLVIRSRRAANCTKHGLVKAFSLTIGNLSTCVVEEKGYLTAQTGICNAMGSQACRARVGTARTMETKKVETLIVICRRVIGMLGL